MWCVKDFFTGWLMVFGIFDLMDSEGKGTEFYGIDL